MGERAYIITTEQLNDNQEFVPAIYVHWLGEERDIQKIVDLINSVSKEKCLNLAYICGVICTYIGYDSFQGIYIDAIKKEWFKEQTHGTYVIDMDKQYRYYIKEHIK